jgi:ABC-2 type transport system ATP-binding protein
MIINKGKIVADGSPEQLRKQAQGREILKITVEDGNDNDIFIALKELNSVEVVERIEPNSGAFEVQSKPESSSRRPIFQLCKEKNWVLTEVTVVETKLEDIFRELTIY